MAKKRANGEGSVFRSKDGYWNAQITIGRKKDGRLHYVRKRFKTMQDALAWKNKSIHELQQKRFLLPNDITLEKWLQLWLETYIKPSVRPKTWENYEYICRCHLVPELGKEKIQKLTSFHFQKMLSDKRNSGLSTRTVDLIRVVTRSAFAQAVNEGILLTNVVDKVRRPNQTKKEIRVLSTDELQRFVQSAMSDRLGTAFALLLGTGLRLGELLALRWDDVDFSQNLIRIRRSAIRLKAPEGRRKTRVVIQAPKSKSGKRDIPLFDVLANLLKEWKRVQVEESLTYGHEYINSGYVVTHRNGTMMDQSNLTRAFHVLLNKASLPKTNIHALRHTYATQLLEKNVHPKVAQELLGHSSITVIMNTYSHVLPEIKKLSVKKLNGMFGTLSPDYCPFPRGMDNLTISKRGQLR
ncbi:tyrosine-type recombinase/integrase [Heliobacterium undosum]|uniref:Tyrosine-type recombinase/integrase n=1 Tax=Heliomicrobium undosum TaxID=121734 RepID=A0A845L131_9FIRM|nr:tyrosine-type recombinase/integrase [Heliomicrobium undosum]MZP28655.1 tyrosine-type recombinase/integrase [Heliomicrobium undosum]